MVSILRINVFFRIQSACLFTSPDSIVRRMILLQVARMFLFKYIEKIVVKHVIHPLFPPRIELRTFSVLGRRDNHYTMETTCIKQYISLLCPINKVWRLIFDVKTHSGKHSAPNGGLEPPTLRLRVSCSTDWASQATLNSQFIFSINLGIFMFWFQSRHHRQQLYLTQRGSATVIHGRHSHYTGDAQRNTDVHR